MEGAGDRRGRHGEEIHVHPRLAQALLVLDSEPLLLVDNEQPEVGEADLLA